MRDRTPDADRKIAAKRWWVGERTDAELAGDILQTFRYLRHHLRARREQDVHHMLLYSNLDVAGQGYNAFSNSWGQDGGRIRYNLCSSIVDTAASVIAQQRPKPQYLTADGDFKLQRQARLRTRVLEGQLYETGAYEIAPKCFIDACVSSLGAVYGYLDPTTSEPKLERCVPFELVVDHAEAIYGKPRTLYRVRVVAREVLREVYADKADLIDKAAQPDADTAKDLWFNSDGASKTADLVHVVETWHLPSAKGAKDGRHVIACSSCTLVNEEWTRDRFPFAFYRWKERQLGFFGMGLVEESRDAQWRINRLIQRINDLSDLGSNMHVMVEGESKFRVDQMTNAPAKVYRYWGTEPKFVTVNAVPTELFQQIEEVREKTFSQLGISSMLAEGKKPAGLNSGQAQRVHDDLQSRRHIMNARNYENFYMDIVRLLEDLNEQAFEKDSSYSVTARTNRGRTQLVKQVKWSSVNLPENRYRLTMFPTSALPTTPEGKWAAVQEWIASGFITRPFAQQLLDFPDLDAATRIELADLDLAMFQVEQILDGEEVMPTPFQKLDLAADIGRKSLLQATINGATEPVLQALRDYVTDCLTMAKSPEAQSMQPPPPQPPQAPMVGPGQPPPGPAGMPPGAPTPDAMAGAPMQ